MATNLNRLVIAKMARDAIPSGGGIQAGIDFLSDPRKVAAGYAAAEKWVMQAITVLRTANEPNPYRYASDEQIAGEILAELDKRKRK